MRIRNKEHPITLTPEDLLDVKLWIMGRAILKFSLNYRAFIDGDWKQIYRIDNFHGFLHEQKFWRSPKPLPLPDEDKLPMNDVVYKYADKIVANFLKYKTYFIEAEKKKKEKNEKQTKKARTRKKGASS